MGAGTGACGELRQSAGDCLRTGKTARHGNFFDPAYAAIAARPEWMRRFDKIHAQGRALPKAESGPPRWRELDSSMSSDALLMNVFCTPGVAEAPAVRRTLGVDGDEPPVFGWKARVPLEDGRFDRTEVDMRLGFAAGRGQADRRRLSDQSRGGGGGLSGLRCGL